MKKILLIIGLAFMTSKTLAQAPSNGLVAYFEFENSLNSSISSDVFVNTGVSNATFATGRHSQGVSFNGSVRLSIASLTETISNLENSCTITWWEFRPAAPPSLDTYSFRMGNNFGYRYKGSSGCSGITYTDRYQIELTTWTFTNKCVTVNTHAAQGGTWYHHAITKLNNNLKYYLNGTLSFVGTSGITLDSNSFSSTTTNLFQLGYGSTDTTNMIGTIDDLAIYKRALSAGEIATITSSGNSGVIPSTKDVGDVSLTTSSQKIYYSVYGSGYSTTTKVFYGTTNPPNSGSSFVVGGTATNAVLHDKLNATITGLTPGTQYYYRIEAANSQGSNFSTQPTYTFVAGGSNEPVVNFPFDGNTSTFNNSYTLNPVSTAPTYVDDRSGAANKAVYLNNKVLTVNVPVLPVTTATRTVSFWMQQRSSTNNNIFGWGTYSSNYAFGASSYINSFVVYGGPTGYGYTTPINYDNKWHHYAITYDGFQVVFYQDGILQATYTTTASNLSTQGTTLYIGGQSGNASTPQNDMYLDDFQVFNQALFSQGVFGLFMSQNSPTLTTQDFNTQNLKASIYPNPAKDILNIEMENEVKSIEIYSLQGQKVLESTSKQINVSNLSKGLYMVRIEDENKAVATKKLVIE